MSITISTLVILLALDGSVGQGIPPVVARFGGDKVPAVEATFARHPADSMPKVEIVWFLDGDALAVPVRKSTFSYDRTPAKNPVLTQGSFALDLPTSEKTETYRGAIFNVASEKKLVPLAVIRLVLFPPDAFTRRWQAMAAAKIPLALAGELPGMREFLRGLNIQFVEADLNTPGADGRDGMLVVDAADKEDFLITPGLARVIMIFAAPDRSWQSRFETLENGKLILWGQRPIHHDFAQDPLAQAQFLHLAESLTKSIP